MANSENSQRGIRDLQGLLRACVEATRHEDAPNNPTVEQMDPERRQFLENALKMLSTDLIEKLEKATACLVDEGSTEAEQLASLEFILIFAEHIDSANDFIKVGGLDVILLHLDSNSKIIRTKILLILAELTQNNPFAQSKVLEKNVLPKFIELLTDKDTCAAAIKAISCEIRNFDPAQVAFIEIGGLECLMGCLQFSDEKLIIRTLYLINSLCAEVETYCSEFVKLNVTQYIINVLQPSAEYSDLLEATLFTLNVIADNEDAARQCRESTSNLLVTLETILKGTKGKEECYEIIDYCETIINKVFKQSSGLVDR